MERICTSDDLMILGSALAEFVMLNYDNNEHIDINKLTLI